MPLTKEEIITRFLPNQLVKRRKNIVWGDVVSAIASINNTQKESILERLRNKEYASVGRIISEAVVEGLLREVQADLENKLANNSLNIEELSEIIE